MQTRKICTTLILLLFLLSQTSKSQSGWKELRSYGINSFSTTAIQTLAEDYSSQVVYAGIGSQVIKWEGGGASWAQLGTDTAALNADGIIYSITTDRLHNVYAAGWFTNASGKCYVAKWNGSSYINNNWTELGGENGLNPSGPIYSITSDSVGNIYAAGAFISTANGGRYVAKWDGTKWTELGSGNNALKANNSIRSICVDGLGNVYAAGAFTNSSGKYYVAKWNGTNWTEIGTGSAALNANGRIMSISADPQGHITAAGAFTNSNNHYYVARWDGVKWMELGSGDPLFIFNGVINSVITDPYGQIYTAGEFTDNNSKSFVAWWHGSKWDTIGVNKLNANAPILSIAIDNRSRIFAAGEFINNVGFKYVADCASIENYWKETAASGVGSFNATNTNVIITNKNADTLFTAGSFSIGGYNVNKWDGSSWKDHGAFNANKTIKTMVIDKNDNIYVAGEFQFANNPLVAKWDGSTWVDLGNSANALKAFGEISKIALDSFGNLYATGYFINQFGKYYVAKWDGTSWSELGAGLNTGINAEEPLTALTVDKDGNVYVGAYRRNPFSASSFDYYVSKWDGRAWKYLGNGPDDLPLDRIRYIETDSYGNVYSTMSTWSLDFIRKWNGNSWSRLPNSSGATLILIGQNNNLFALFDTKVKRWGGDGFYEVGNSATTGLKVTTTLHGDNKGNLYTVGYYEEIYNSFIAKYDSSSLATPFITYVKDHCSEDSSAKGKLYNPPINGTITIMQDGFPLNYNPADSSFQYFNNGVTAVGNHTITVKYINGTKVLTDSSTYKVTKSVIAIANIFTPDTLVCAGTLFTITCSTNITGASYQWYIDNWPCIYNCNDSSISLSLSSTNNNINIYCKVGIPATQCAPTANILTNTIFMKLGNPAPPEVSISSNDSDNIICTNQKIVFTAIPVNGGLTPHYQWKINGINTGLDSNKIEMTDLQDRDQISVAINKSNSCSSQLALSNLIMVNKDTSAIHLTDTLQTICSSSTKMINIGAPIKPGYTYSWTSLPTGFISNVSNPGVLPTINTTYYVKQTNSTSGCTSENHVTVKIDNSCMANYNPLYPNPANDFVNIVLESPVGSDVVMFQLIASNGVNYFSTRLYDTINRIDLKLVNTGFYGFVITKNGSVIKEGRLMIVH